MHYCNCRWRCIVNSDWFCKTVLTIEFVYQRLCVFMLYLWGFHLWSRNYSLHSFRRISKLFCSYEYVPRKSFNLVSASFKSRRLVCRRDLEFPRCGSSCAIVCFWRDASSEVILESVTFHSWKTGDKSWLQNLLWGLSWSMFLDHWTWFEIALLIDCCIRCFSVIATH